MSEPELGFWSDDSQLCIIPLPHLFALSGKVNNSVASVLPEQERVSSKSLL